MNLQGIVGIIFLTGLAWLISENRRAVRFQIIFTSLAVQFALALILLKIPIFGDFFILLNRGVNALERATAAGTTFAFGYLGGGKLPFAETYPGSTFIFAFKALPLILVVSALSSLLFYWKILPLVVRAFSWLLQKTLRVGGAVGVGAAANVFLGMVEAPLLIRPYLGRLTRSELFITMSCGMANIAGTVMVLYATILCRQMPDVMGHILIASIISTPAAIMISLLMVPETGEITLGQYIPPQNASSAMDAITRGTSEGISLYLNIIAMLIVLVALVELGNQILSLLPFFHGEPVTLQRLLGYVMAPVTWMIGIPWSESMTAGFLLGEKTILNELIAYLDLSRLPAGSLNARSQVIMVYALCGFANLGSLGILIGGMAAMVPERRNEIVSLGFKSILCGTMATCMVGAIVGLLL
ncbi:MAG: nucleoside:proton symporter [Deltaproteobacteria bacterium]|nr:nucleoside:proton symporter [Deltaproteobacteria bacterium]